MDVMIADETSAGAETARLLLQGVPSPVTLRELIKLRVREEVARHNADPVPRFNGLVRPSAAETTLNGYLDEKRRRISWERQAEVAIEAFERNGFFVFVGDRQVGDLQEELTLADTDVVTFVRLVPLVGG
jgi:hypothetical protein